MDRRLRILLASLLVCALTLPIAASGAVFAPRAIDRYSSASMWPTLVQQKYLANIGGMAPTNDNLCVWASDQNNHRLLKVRVSDGAVVQTVGRFGSGNGQFNKPCGIAVRPATGTDPGDILVCDYGNNRVQVFDSNGNFRRSFGFYGAGLGQMKGPIDVALDSNGMAYVAEQGQPRIQQFSTSYAYANTWTTTNTTKCLTVYGGIIWVGETNGSSVALVREYDAGTPGGVPVGGIGSWGTADGQFHSPCDISVTTDGKIVVVDESLNRVKKFETNGTWIANLAESPTGFGFWEMDFVQIPRAVAVAGADLILVADSTGIKKYHNSVQAGGGYAYDGAGWTGGSYLDGWLYSPNAIACGTSGTSKYVWVADAELNRIQKFTVDTAGKLTYAGVKITGAYGANAQDIATDTDGNLYVAATYLDKVRKFNSAGVYQSEWASNDPWGIDVYSGKVYVTDYAGDTVRIYTTAGAPASPASVVGGVPAIPSVPSLANPLDVAVTGAAVFVLDHSQPYVKKYRPDGTESALNDYLGSWGNSTEEFVNGPDAISADRFGKVYLVDTETGRIAKYDGNGVYLGDVGSPGSGTGEVSRPADVAISDELDTFVLERGSMRVQTFRPNRATKSKIVPGSAPAYAKPASFNLYAYDADGKSIEQYHTMKFRYGYSAKGPWSSWKTTWGNGTGYTTTWNLTRRTYFQAYTVKTTTSPYLASYSPVISIAPKVVLATPVAPATMSHLSNYSVSALLKPRHTAGTYPVRIYKYRYVSGAWKSYGYVTARAADYSTYTKCTASVKLPYAGTWKLRAYAPADSLHAATWSAGMDTVVVK